MIRSIYSQNRAGYIGKDGKLMYHIPRDLENFRKRTIHSIVIMGRKTWESLPDSVRPLPNRTNVVISTTMESDDEKHVFTTLKEAINHYEFIGDIWIIGGTRILEEGMEYVDEILQTIVHDEMVGDTLAPDIPGYFEFRESTTETVGELTITNNWLRRKT